MDKDRFHKAARDGLLDCLRNTTRKDCNEKDEDGFTPVISAAYSGRLDALRILVGRGGDPDKCDLHGNTSLHWSSANGHFDCVTFLVNFGCNIWCLNNDFQTAKDFAALRNHKIILDYLDSMMAKQTELNPKLIQKSKEKAISEAEKRIAKFEKIQRKATKKAEKEEKQNERNRRKLFEPIQITNNNRLQSVEYSSTATTTINTTGTLRWTTSNLKNKDVPLKFSDLVNNTNTIQRTNQFNSLLANVKGTLNGSTSSKLVRSLGAVSRKVQLKKQLTTNSDDQQQNTGQLNEKEQKPILNKDQCTNVNLNLSTVRSLTALCRDTDVLYVKKDYGLETKKLNSSNLLHLNQLNDLNNSLKTLNKMNSDNLNGNKKDVKCDPSDESNRIKQNEEKTSLPNSNSSVKSLDNNNNKRNLDQNVDSLNKAKLKLKELFVKTSNENTIYRRNDKGKKQNSINNKMTTLLKKGLTRATSEPDLTFNLKNSESNKFQNLESSLNYQNSTGHILNSTNNRSQIIQSTTKLNSLSNSSNNSTTNSLNSSIFNRPGFGTMAFRHNLFAQVLQLSKQLNEDNDYEGVDTFKRSFNNLNKTNKLIVQKHDLKFTNNHQQTTNRLQLIQKMNKQLRNEQENDSIGNSLSSRSTNSSTNSTLSSDLIETELTDDLNMKLSTQYKTRKSLKSIQPLSSANHHDMNKQLLNHAILDQKNLNKFDKKLDNQVNEQEPIIKDNNNEIDLQLNSQVNKQLNEERTNEQINQQVDQNETFKIDQNETFKKDQNETFKKDQNEEVLEKQIIDKQCVENLKKVDQNDKLDNCRKISKTYHETYEKLNGQTLNLKDKMNKTATNDKLYEKKNEKLLKIKDKFLNRLNARLDDEKDLKIDQTTTKLNSNLIDDKQTEKLNNSLDQKLDLIKKSLDDSSDNNSTIKSSNCSTLNKKGIDQLDELEERFQDAGQEIAIENVPTICASKTNNCTFISLHSSTNQNISDNNSLNSSNSSNSSSISKSSMNHEPNFIESRIKKFENINKLEKNCRTDLIKDEKRIVENNDVKIHLNEHLKETSLKESHVQKMLVKNRESNDTQNSLSDSTPQTKLPLTCNLSAKNLTSSNQALNVRIATNLPTITNSSVTKTLNPTFKKAASLNTSSPSELPVTVPVRTTSLNNGNLTVNIFSNCKKANNETNNSVGKSSKTNIELLLANQDLDLEQFVELFKREKIDFDEFMLSNEQDLIKFGISEAKKKLTIAQKESTKRSLQDTFL